MNRFVSLALAAALAIPVIGCSKKSSDAAAEDLGTALGNSLVLGFAKDQYQKAKSTYDKGEDANLECIMDTSELRKDKSADAQKLADDIDTLCDVDVPARHHQKALDEKLADVQASKKSKDGLLESNRLLLKFACEDADKAIKDIQGKRLDAKPNAKALSDKKAQVCTADNLEGKAKKTAQR